MLISIVDCQMGNIGSIKNIIEHIGHQANIISTPAEILTAEKLVFPGVGHWDNGASKLEELNLKSALIEAVNEKQTPMLGICLGMQLLFSESQEGMKTGLALIPGNIKKFDFTKISTNKAQKKLRIPHMGWNRVKPIQQDSILQNLECDARFYFVHSFHADNVPEENQLLSCHYGYDFVCTVRKQNIWGVQFHPEKSHKYGMQLFKNFIENS